MALGERIPTQLRGRRVVLRPLSAADFDGWREVRQRNRGWLLKWEPKPPPGAPDDTESRPAFVARCGAREREWQMGSGYGFGIFVERAVRGRAQPVGRAAGPVPERLRRLLDRRGPGRQRLRPRGPGGGRPASPSRSCACTGCRWPSSPATGPAGGWRRSSTCGRRASPTATWPSTACGRTTSATPSPPRTGPTRRQELLDDVGRRAPPRPHLQPASPQGLTAPDGLQVAHRVDGVAVDADLEVEVGAGARRRCSPPGR